MSASRRPIPVSLMQEVLSTPSRQREGVDIQFAGGQSIRGQALLSEKWSMGGWSIQFVQLAANTTMPLEQTQGRVFVKVVSGGLIEPNRRPFAPAQTVRNTLVQGEHMTAGDEDTLLAVFTETDLVPANISDMQQLTVRGPHAEAFQWRTFADRFGKFLPAFIGADAYMSGGFHLLDADGSEITYVNLWTAGKGVDLTTHNHAQPPGPQSPAFAEVHWVFNNGSGSGGMYSADTADGPRTAQYPMQRGDEHGAFFLTDPATRQPKLRKNGAVEYPWHGWQAGTDDQPGQAYDVVAAFETNPDYVRV